MSKIQKEMCLFSFILLKFMLLLFTDFLLKNLVYLILFRCFYDRYTPHLKVQLLGFKIHKFFMLFCRLFLEITQLLCDFILF